MLWLELDGATEALGRGSGVATGKLGIAKATPGPGIARLQGTDASQLLDCRAHLPACAVDFRQQRTGAGLFAWLGRQQAETGSLGLPVPAMTPKRDRIGNSCAHRGQRRSFIRASRQRAAVRR
jgi:hypothetical protein